jgi:hypothetical protein
MSNMRLADRTSDIFGKRRIAGNAVGLTASFVDSACYLFGQAVEVAKGTVRT